jgi:hypothetical protein
MRVKVKDAVADGREVHVIHLGDVYYCGRAGEYSRRFFDYWPVKPGDALEDVHSWNLNGNHDMYAGGFGYFGVIAGDTKIDERATLFAQQGGCSYFKLHNEHWRIYGLDTAYQKDQHLWSQQLPWIREQLRGGGGQAMLLSHHQLDSVYDRARVNGVLLDELGEDLKAGRVRAWFWGPRAPLRPLALCRGRVPAVHRERWCARGRRDDAVRVLQEGRVVDRGPVQAPPCRAPAANPRRELKDVGRRGRALAAARLRLPRSRRT